jgi:hypothetical protein
MYVVYEIQNTENKKTQKLFASFNALTIWQKRRLKEAIINYIF